ncbi:MAG: PspC domain-containing protein [Gaiellales bacterium]
MNELIADHQLSFRRSRADRVVGGVAGALGPRLGLSTRGLRVAFVGLGLLGPGIPLYLAALVGTRVEGDDRELAPPRSLVAGLLVLAGAVTPLWLRANDLPPYRNEDLPLAVLALLIGAGGLFVFGRRPPVAPGRSDKFTRVYLPTLRLPQPPTLLLLTLSVATVAGLVTWLAVRARDGVENYGATAASALIVVGLGVALGAWRGRSFLLLPIGLALATPLALAAATDLRLDLGRDNPGALAGTGATSRTFVLGRGAGPVTVTRAAVESGLRTLVIRKPAGTIDVRIDPAIPANIELATIAGRGWVLDAKGEQRAWLDNPGTSMVSLPAAGDDVLSTPLTLRIESAFGSINVFQPVSQAAVEHQQAADLKYRLTNMRVDLSGRRGLLARERATLAKLDARYARTLAALARLTTPSPTASRVPEAILRIDEASWQSMRVEEPLLRERDPVLDELARSRRALQLATDLRFEILRASWRVASIERGIGRLEKRITTLEKGASK